MRYDLLSGATQDADGSVRSAPLPLPRDSAFLEFTVFGPSGAVVRTVVLDDRHGGTHWTEGLPHNLGIGHHWVRFPTLPVAARHVRVDFSPRFQEPVDFTAFLVVDPQTHDHDPAQQEESDP